uniref:Uncharacterized protein n=1 Tax=Entomoneis paludosa TaxID=265537 RepID=A0A7S3DQV2_9STRA|mmetsp:Transcript_2970/g.6052  ORF Transcript_2970/g.6052 Transcript_2970/m.6052 type:complete len:767 (+) Transcript_2970:146-2446(+)
MMIHLSRISNLTLLLLVLKTVGAFQASPLLRRNLVIQRAVPGADIEQPPLEEENAVASTTTTAAATPSAAAATSNIPSSFSKSKAKVNEIDFCIAPADASLSRAYGTFAEQAAAAAAAAEPATSATASSPPEEASSSPMPSLTRALNNASNRAVRRILLARSWPSAEALNLSLRRVAQAEREQEERQQQQDVAAAVATLEGAKGDDAPKCPVPRPILNVLTRNNNNNKRNDISSGGKNPNIPRKAGRTDEEYVADQLTAFRERYGALPGYQYSEAYLDSILSLATSGMESVRAPEVMESGVYDDAYRRIESVLRTVGVEFEIDEATERRKIAPKLIDQDICWSMLDKIRLRQEKETGIITPPTLPPPPKVAEEEFSNQQQQSDTEATVADDETVSASNIDEQAETDKEKVEDVGSTEFKLDGKEDVTIVRGEDGVEVYKPNIQFWKKKNQATTDDTDGDEESEELSKEDLGGVLLSKEEPTMTRQLNILSNIARRALLFGGDQELLVLSETLDADRAAFIERWYPGTEGLMSEMEETRPGVQFLNSLIALLRNCYNQGVVVDMQPPVPLSLSYANAYERLVATAVELGSGYLKPDPGLGSTDTIISSMPTPRTPKEELGRFAVWEAAFRQQKYEASAYPEDLKGKWEVTDLIGGETIGVCTVVLGEDGQVDLDGPLEGLRWRCDPGPTHLDTCTFQVLGSDGTILQYRGFIDRGARLEARYSKRPINIRGRVMFQMRDGSVDYFKDMLPINYRDGTTKFVMRKIME